MSQTETITFNVTSSQLETIKLRASENGFDDVSSYIKVVALKTGAFNKTPVGQSNEAKDNELSFSVSPTQRSTINDNVDKSEFDTLQEFLEYTCQHAVISCNIEVRSTGGLDSMLARIAKGRNLKL